MSGITRQKSDQGWIVELPSASAAALGVSEGAIAVFYARNGKIETEILPAPSQKLRDISKRISEKYQEAFEEMKRLGD